MILFIHLELFTSVVFCLVSPGYIIAFNATEYEYDINVYSPVGTIVFEVLLDVENFADTIAITVTLAGNADNFGHYSINGMNSMAEFVFLPVEMPANPLLTITLNGTLDPNDTNTDNNFMIVYTANHALQSDISDSVNVILHEISELRSYYYLFTTLANYNLCITTLVSVVI